MGSVDQVISRRAVLRAVSALAGTAVLAAIAPKLAHTRQWRKLELNFLLRTGGLRHVLRSKVQHGWTKPLARPVLGGDLGTCFDACSIWDCDRYRMWFSWRPQKSIALVESLDGISWSRPVIVLRPRNTGWEDQINRPVVIKCNGLYYMWYTGQTESQSFVGRAVSPDGISWTRDMKTPVISPDLPWEVSAVMCPHVIYDESEEIYKMWYSAGEQFEPMAIGYASSDDGIHWRKHGNGPVFGPGARGDFDQDRVTACCVTRQAQWYVMFYAGFEDEADSAIGIARSSDGVTKWQRHPMNPIVVPGNHWKDWDLDSVYKPTVILEDNRWMLWYNGRRASIEQIGLAIHEGNDLGFPELKSDLNGDIPTGKQKTSLACQLGR